MRRRMHDRSSPIEESVSPRAAARALAAEMPDGGHAPPPGMAVCAYVTDVEGNLDYFERYVAISKVLAWADEEKTKLTFKRDDAIFVFGGHPHAAQI